LKYEDARKTVLSFIADLPDRETYLKLKPIIEKSGHLEFIDSFVKYCVLKKEKKNGAVWLHGAPNSGKTTLLGYLKEIFEIVPFV